MFILGAGASMPYGFPSGEELVGKIIKELSEPTLNQPKRILCELDFSEYDIQLFQSQLRLSQRSSIDAFLEYRPEFLKIGKAAIATILIPYEKENELYDRGDWYKYLFNRLDRNFSGREHLTFVTYNYDRSLEHYFFTSSMSSFGFSRDETEKFLSDISFIHIHGHLGFLPWQNEVSRPYTNGEVSATIVAQATRNIKIISDDVEDSTEYKIAGNCLLSAQRVCFLGFGFHPINVTRILGSNWLSKRPGLDGTAFGMTGSERRQFLPYFKEQLHLQDAHVDCLNFLRNSNVFLL